MPRVFGAVAYTTIAANEVICVYLGRLQEATDYVSDSGRYVWMIEKQMLPGYTGPSLAIDAGLWVLVAISEGAAPGACGLCSTNAEALPCC